MQHLKNIYNTEDRIPKEYREKYSIEEIKKHFEALDFSEITNPNIFNLKALITPISKVVTRTSVISSIHTADLEIDHESHSYYANGIPTHNTVNLPNDYPYEDFKNVYMDAWKSNLKGITTYRMGTMSSVVTAKNEDAEKETVEDILVRKSPKRPEELVCHVYKIKVKGDDWVVFIGIYKDYPYEVFAGKELDVALPSKIKEGLLIKRGKGKYAFSYDGEVLIKDVKKLFENKEQEALTRQISLNLRHGTPLNYIIEQLSKSNGTIVDFSKSIIRALKKYIKEEETGSKCPSCDAITFYIEGCETCRNCGWSKCG